MILTHQMMNILARALPRATIKRGCKARRRRRKNEGTGKKSLRNSLRYPIYVTTFNSSIYDLRIGLLAFNS